MKQNTYERINITLPSQTVRLLDDVAEYGSRSRLIDTAVHFYISNYKREQVRAALKEGALARSARDRTLVRELFDFTDTWEK